MKPWTDFELEIVKFGVARGYTAKDMAPSLPGRSLHDIINEIAKLAKPREPWRVRYVHCSAEDDDPLAGTDRKYRERMADTYEEYARRWDEEAQRMRA